MVIICNCGITDILATACMNRLPSYNAPLWPSSKWSCTHNPRTSFVLTLDCVAHLSIRVNHLVRSMVLNRVVLDPHLKFQQALEFHLGINTIIFCFILLEDGVGSSTLLMPPSTIALFSRLRSRNNDGR